MFIEKEPSGADENSGHVRQFASDIEAFVVEYVLASHFTHLDCPVLSWNLPGVHATQTSRARPEYPLSHRHMSIDMEPSSADENLGHARHVTADIAAFVVEYVLALHFLQLVCPGTSLNLPGMHATQTSCAYPEYPLSHRQWLLVLLPATELELEGHGLQLPDDSDPNSSM